MLIIKSALCSCTLPLFYPERCTVIDLLHAVLRTENGAHQADKLPLKFRFYALLATAEAINEICVVINGICEVINEICAVMNEICAVINGICVVINEICAVIN